MIRNEIMQCIGEESYDEIETFLANLHLIEMDLPRRDVGVSGKEYFPVVIAYEIQQVLYRKWHLIENVLGINIKNNDCLGPLSEGALLLTLLENIVEEACSYHAQYFQTDRDKKLLSVIEKRIVYILIYGLQEVLNHKVIRSLLLE